MWADVMEPKPVEDVLALLEKRPHDAELHQLLGNLYFERGELKKAWQPYMTSLKLNPDDPFTCLFFANLLTLCNDKSFAMKLYKRAAKLSPDLAVAHWCRARLLRDLGKYKEAEKAYKRAVAAEPENHQAKEKLAEWQTFIAGVHGR
jgi:protein O-GlcNAc transferase